MRRGELLSLQWSDVHIDQSFCHLPITKNGSIRDVPLSGRAKTLLSDLPRDNELVFPIHFEALKGLWKRAIKRAGIDDLHFHYLRHVEDNESVDHQYLHVLLHASKAP